MDLISDLRPELFQRKYIFWVKYEQYAAKNAIFQQKISIFQESILLFLPNAPWGTFIPGGTVIPDHRVGGLAYSFYDER